jgi:FKBP-type peptidyl-prolyl cis-trans isomerase FkpA
MTKYLFYVLFLGLVSAGCNSVEFKKTKGGMPYKLWESKSGKKVENGKFIKVHVTQKMNDSLMFTTYTGLPAYFQVSAADAKYDITEILPQLKEGDSVMAIQLMDTFIKRDPSILQRTKFKKGDKVTTTFRILKVFDRAEDYMQDEEKEKKALAVKEEEAVKNYLKKNNIDAIRTPNGAYVQIISQGTGADVDSGKYVRVMYTGKTFEGKTFDSNTDTTFGHTEPLGFVVGQRQMIAGFDEGVQLLKVGAKAKIYMPSMLGYGPQPPSPDIKPYEHLVFDVEVLDIADKAPAQPQVPNINPTEPNE